MCFLNTSNLIWLVAINVFRFVLSVDCPRDAAGSLTPPFFGKNFNISISILWPWTQWLFRAPGMFYPFILCLSAFSNWCPLVWILLLTIYFQPGRRLLCRRLFYTYSHFWRDCFRVGYPHLGSHWIHLILVYSTFSPIWVSFCVLLQPMFTFALLLIFEVLMDPNGLPLQVINLTLESTMA